VTACRWLVGDTLADGMGIGNERLPTELGWKRPADAFTTDILLKSLETVREEYRKQLNATSQTRRRSGGSVDRLLFARQALTS
jgi:hypothetical protein